MKSMLLSSVCEIHGPGWTNLGSELGQFASQPSSEKAFVGQVLINSCWLKPEWCVQWWSRDSLIKRNLGCAPSGCYVFFIIIEDWVCVGMFLMVFRFSFCKQNHRIPYNPRRRLLKSRILVSLLLTRLMKDHPAFPASFLLVDLFPHWRSSNN